MDTDLIALLGFVALFALMLRIKDSRRLPGGIRFELCTESNESSPASTSGDSESEPSAPVSHILLHSIPLPLSHTFTQYAHLTHRLRKHYLSPRVFLCLVSGQFVPPIHRKNLYSLQYSMLPARRVGVGELWRLLSEGEGGADEDGFAPSASSSTSSVNRVAGRSRTGGSGGGSGSGGGGNGGYWWSR